MTLSYTTRLGLSMGAKGDAVGSWIDQWNQDAARAEARLAAVYAGNPNGNVEGVFTGQLCWDSTNKIMYHCTTAGNAASAVWKAFSQVDVAETRSAQINMADQKIVRPYFQDFAFVTETVAAASTTTLNLENANFFIMTQDTNISTLNFTNPPATGRAGIFYLMRVKDATVTARTITWPASVNWSGGTAPSLTQTTGAVDLFAFITKDAGTDWHGVPISVDSR